MQVETLKIIEFPEFEMYRDNDFVVRGFNKGWEFQTLWAWGVELSNLNALGSAYTVFDVGAYTGIYALLSAVHGNWVNVHAFEPLPQVFKRLDDNFILNAQTIKTTRPKNVLRVHNYGLSDEEQMTEINVTGDSPLPSGSSIGPHGEKPTLRNVPVMLMRGDSLKLTAPVKLVKIDVEGHELNVLKGMTDIIFESHPTFFIELLDTTQFHAVREYLQIFGYNSIHQINDNPVLSGPQHEQITETPVIEEYKTNFIFKKV